ncbi:hypothetical protein [Paractinoplanes hotanensis]|uniref:Uncharacterized protein n=1 Tax=Paractinoplanes hotanensis TaxID=2906497 RepID=A0ABT0YDG9_9ACTN|nr:hypothetical protein [Actinoplanes hotanensis]MCM4083795.1 hypothetical protein [Actinoplanes hotanensis]
MTPDGVRVLDALVAMQRQSWEQGGAAQAALDQFQVNDDRVRVVLVRDDLAYLMASSAVARQTPNGRLGGPDGNAVNGAACGEAVVRADFPGRHLARPRARSTSTAWCGTPVARRPSTARASRPRRRLSTCSRR